MRIVRNERRINVLRSVGQYASLAGLVILIGGLIISFVRPLWTGPLVASMSLGFLLSIIGGFYADRYAGPLARHKTLAEVLKGLDYRHTLIQYLLPAEHVLLEPGGCTCFVVKPQGGTVTYDPDRERWEHRERGKFFRRLVGQESLGKPHVEGEEEIGRLQRYLNKKMDDDADVDVDVDVPIRAVIVFINEDVEVRADEAPLPTFYRKKVKDWLRGPGALDPLPDHVQQRLAVALGVAESGDRTDD